MHQGSTDTGSLPVWEDTQRPETQSWLGIDVGPRGDYVANYQAVLHRNQRQRRNPTDILTQPRDQGCFARVPAWLHRRCAVLGAAERVSRDRADRLNVFGKLTSDHHHGTVGARSDCRQHLSPGGALEARRHLTATADSSASDGDKTRCCACSRLPSTRQIRAFCLCPGRSAGRLLWCGVHLSADRCGLVRGTVSGRAFLDDAHGVLPRGRAWSTPQSGCCAARRRSAGSVLMGPRARRVSVDL